MQHGQKCGGAAKLLVTPGDGILDVTCQSELKIRSGLKCQYNAEIKRTLCHTPVSWVRGKLFSEIENWKEAYELYLVLNFIPTIEERLVVPLGNSKRHARSYLRKNMKQTNH